MRSAGSRAWHLLEFTITVGQSLSSRRAARMSCLRNRRVIEAGNSFSITTTPHCFRMQRRASTLGSGRRIAHASGDPVDVCALHLARRRPGWCPASPVGTRSRPCPTVERPRSRSRHRTPTDHPAAPRSRGSPARSARCHDRSGCPGAGPVRSDRRPVASAGRPGPHPARPARGTGQQNPQRACGHRCNHPRASQSAGSSAPASR